MLAYHEMHQAYVLCHIDMLSTCFVLIRLDLGCLGMPLLASMLRSNLLVANTTV